MIELNEQVKEIEWITNSQGADFSLLEKLHILVKWFGDDPRYSQRALDIVRSNLCREHKDD